MIVHSTSVQRTRRALCTSRLPPSLVASVRKGHSRWSGIPFLAAHGTQSIQELNACHASTQGLSDVGVSRSFILVRTDGTCRCRSSSPEPPGLCRPLRDQRHQVEGSAHRNLCSRARYVQHVRSDRPAASMWAHGRWNSGSEIASRKRYSSRAYEEDSVENVLKEQGELSMLVEILQ
jgi:hypothetical protein